MNRIGVAQHSATSNPRAGGGEHATILALFLVLCGLALLAAPRSPRARPEAPQTPARVAEATRNALDAAARAEFAIKGANYGEAELQILRARLHLENAIQQIESDKPKP